MHNSRIVNDMGGNIQKERDRNVSVIFLKKIKIACRFYDLCPLLVKSLALDGSCALCQFKRWNIMLITPSNME